jgi:hypothetical protein
MRDFALTASFRERSDARSATVADFTVAFVDEDAPQALPQPSVGGVVGPSSNR